MISLGMQGENEAFERYLCGKGWHERRIWGQWMWEHPNYGRFTFAEAIRRQEKATRMAQAGRKGHKPCKYTKRLSEVFCGCGWNVATAKQIDAHAGACKTWAITL